MSIGGTRLGLSLHHVGCLRAPYRLGYESTPQPAPVWGHRALLYLACVRDAAPSWSIQCRSGSAGLDHAAGLGQSAPADLLQLARSQVWSGPAEAVQR